MHIKWIGALCVMIGCGGWGFLMALQHMNRIRFLKNLLSILDYMECELQYRATALPQLCRQAGEQSMGTLRTVLLSLADELDAQIAPNAHLCMAAVLGRTHGIDDFSCHILLDFSSTLGSFDIAGQIKGLDHTRKLCGERLDSLMENRENRMRSYQTLGLCAGAAIAILLV